MTNTDNDNDKKKDHNNNNINILMKLMICDLEDDAGVLYAMNPCKASIDYLSICVNMCVYIYIYIYIV